MCTWLFTTEAAFNAGGSFWKGWNKKFSISLVKGQRITPKAIKAHYSGMADEEGVRPVLHVDVGHWPDPDTPTLWEGNVCSTTLAILMLEAYYRHVPLAELHARAGEVSVDPPPTGVSAIRVLPGEQPKTP